MYKICVFAGTTEGREIVEFLSFQQVEVTACVATEYGEMLLPKAGNLHISAQRLTEAEMETLFCRERFDLVIDATHPYASAVTENIAAACNAAGTAYHRLLRTDTDVPENGIFVESAVQAAAYLDKVEGNILLTTGSKELQEFSSIHEFAQRVYARVLPMEESLRLCREAGLKPGHIIAMQGPFTVDMNVAMLKSVGASYLVTKASSNAGGFGEKIAAAEAAGVVPVIIGRPPQREGTDMAATMELLCRRFSFRQIPQVTLVGISFSGGSGRARIICNKVTVKNGKAYATIQFVSASGSPTAYAYVKASGKIYYPTGTSTFTIPVELNKNNRILGMTTKMSAAHEIEYTIFVQLKTGENAVENPDNTGSNLSAQAPEIMGLTFKEEIQLEHAAYLKLFRYEGDIVLAEIDLTRDTVLDTDEALEALAEADELAAQEKKASASSEEESTDTAQIKADYVAALYKKDVLRYLLVPANAELPAGLEKEYLILTVPPKSLYLMDEEAEGTLEALNALELIKVLGVQTTENEVLKAGLADGSVLFGGSWDVPDYKMLVRAKTDLALASGKLLPLSDEVLAERKQEKGADREELTAVEYRNRLYELADRFAVLDIPLLIDRSADEKDALAQADWLRLYGVLLGQEKAAEEMIRKLAAQEGNV